MSEAMPKCIVVLAEDVGKTLGGIHTLWGVIENLTTDVLPCHIDLVIYTSMFDANGTFLIHHEIQDENGICVERLPASEITLTKTIKHIVVTDLQGLQHKEVGKFRVAVMCRAASTPEAEPEVLNYYPYQIFLRSVK